MCREADRPLFRLQPLLLLNRLPPLAALFIVTTNNQIKQASIDLDQQLIEKYLNQQTDEGFAVARNIYEYGAFSRAYAELKLERPLPSDVGADAKIRGVNNLGDPITGRIRQPTKSGTAKLGVLYDTNNDDIPLNGCRVGANPNPIYDECTCFSRGRMDGLPLPVLCTCVCL